MAWDSSRPVPWQNLIRSWLIYVALMAVVFLVFFRDDSLVGIFAGLLVSGPIYLAIGAVLAKFGYQRKTWSELRSEGQTRREAKASEPASDTGPRPRPAPTKRTGGGGGGGGGRPSSGKKRRR